MSGYHPFIDLGGIKFFLLKFFLSFHLGFCYIDPRFSFLHSVPFLPRSVSFIFREAFFFFVFLKTILFSIKKKKIIKKLKLSVFCFIQCHFYFTKHFSFVFLKPILFLPFHRQIYRGFKTYSVLFIIILLAFFKARIINFYFLLFMFLFNIHTFIYIYIKRKYIYFFLLSRKDFFTFFLLFDFLFYFQLFFFKKEVFCL